MKSKLQVVAAFGLSLAIFALVGAGCGPSSSSSTPGTKCSADADCTGSNEVCFKTAGVCVVKCDQDSACPSHSPTCTAVALGGTTASDAGSGSTDGGTTSTTTKVCTCATGSTTCAGSDSASMLVCSNLDKVCVNKCSGNLDCGAGRECDTSNGQCKKAAPTDCEPACATGKYCDKSASPFVCKDKCTPSSCGAGKTCDFATGMCGAPATCVATNAQPDTCTYAHYCDGTACKDIAAAPTCGNWTQAGGATLKFNAGTSTGPIIWKVEDVSEIEFNSSAPGGVAFCGDNTWVAKAKLHVYSPTISLGNDKQPASNPGLKFIDSTGAEKDPVAAVAIRGSGYKVTNSGKNAEITINFCKASPVTQGFRFDLGNEVCATLKQ